MFFYNDKPYILLPAKGNLFAKRLSTPVKYGSYPGVDTDLGRT